eukprot:TRINITY_DN19879_c0_g1_i3.p1 TRINITY_DN19879_c0_g1~~TRINITY_DN19879_c0_g1_i3.p1  ORF type:complete len:256 (-),score=49.21 TRINITY_DN19879_c0_g1_i3:661-1428(-)
MVEMAKVLEQQDILKKVCTLKILEQLLMNEKNQQRFINLSITSKLVSLISEEPNQGSNWEISRLVFKILRVVCSSKEQKYKFKESNALDTVFTFLLKAKKLKIKDNQERKQLCAARNEGLWLVLDFHKEFYDKDMEMTDYMCSRKSIHLLTYGASIDLFSLHHEIPKSEVEEILKNDNMIYCTFFTTTYRGIWKGKEVVIKVFKIEGSVSWTSFTKEITLLSILSHPNLCPFYGASTDKEMPFLVMKYIPRGIFI